MAEMIQSGSRKRSTRVDMTPMVDLGFLLITFFMLTTMLSNPKALPLVMPADGEPVPVGAGKALTILVGANNKVAWYDGQGNDPAAPPKVYTSSFAANKGIGEVIRAKQRKVAQAYGDAEQLVVMIKASPGSKYRNMVDALDEMKINRVARYAVVNITVEEVRLLGEQSR